MLFFYHPPEVFPFIEHAGRNGFGAIDCASAAHCQDDIDVILPAKPHALLDRFNARIWLNARELGYGKAALPQNLHDRIIQADFLYGAAAIGQQHVFAKLLQRFSKMADLAFAKIQLGWNIMRKIQHERTLLIFLILSLYFLKRALSQALAPAKVFIPEWWDGGTCQSCTRS